MTVNIMQTTSQEPTTCIATFKNQSDADLFIHAKRTLFRKTRIYDIAITGQTQKQNTQKGLGLFGGLNLAQHKKMRYPKLNYHISWQPDIQHTIQIISHFINPEDCQVFINELIRTQNNSHYKKGILRLFAYKKFLKRIILKEQTQPTQTTFDESPQSSMHTMRKSYMLGKNATHNQMNPTTQKKNNQAQDNHKKTEDEDDT
jgi:hypothetical protein